MEDNSDHMVLNLTTNSSREERKVLVQTRDHDSMKAKTYSARRAKLKSSTHNVNEKKVPRNEFGEKFQVVSSLFHKNPDIPQISNDVLQSDVQCSKKDETFSGSEFKHLNLAPFMISNLELNLHMTTMTSVQKASLPLLINGKDMFIKSPTGTGKTLAYVIPVVQSLQAITPKIQRVNGPYCVILVPTRELALQSLTVLQQVLKPFIWIVPGCVTGGEKRKSEKARLRKGMNILVATPGRLVDHLKTTECLQMSNLHWLILDEADRLLEMGFEQDLSFILSTIKDQAKQKIQTVLLSATLSQGVEKLADITLDKPATINMTEQDDSSVNTDLVEYETPNQLKQYCIVVPMKLRLVTLAAFLKQNYEKDCKIIVFFTTQDSVDFHHQLFSTILTTTQGKTMKIMKLHGKLSQQDRTKIFLDFKKSNIGVLLCTDVAARGLDLPSVQWIVQYNPAVSVTDYVHRVGRTARIGSSGKALLFLLPTEVAFLNVLKEHKLRLEEMKTDDILNVLLTDQFKLSKMSDVEQFHTAVTYQHTLFEEALSNASNLRELAKTAFHSFIGAYNTFPATLKSIFHAKNLHLGHLAKSFAFRETPTELKEKISKNTKRKRSAQLVQRKTKQDKKRQMVSELGCDELINGPLTKKAKRTKLQ